MNGNTAHVAPSCWQTALAACRPEDFDGHPAFARLTPGERLDWLDEAAQFLLELRSAAGAAPLPESTQKPKVHTHEIHT